MHSPGPQPPPNPASHSSQGKSQASGENPLPHPPSDVPLGMHVINQAQGARHLLPRPYPAPVFWGGSGQSWAACFGAPMLCHCKWMKRVCPLPRASKMCDRPVSSCLMASLPLGTNFSELLNIQKRDCPCLGPSFRNSWPNPLPHLPQETLGEHKTAT